MDQRLRALNRFGLGAHAGERDTITDPRGWLLEQFAPANATLRNSSKLPTDEELGAALRELRRLPQIEDESARQTARRTVRDLVTHQTSIALTQRLISEAPFVERLVAFWSNHLCVSAEAAPLVRIFAEHYERTVVRPNVLGKFEDLLLASARHPAMLIYLNNAQSIGPNSRAARMVERRRDRTVGLNENYARELLELHTVGVDGGYMQADVQQLARVLTGWTIDGVGGRGAMSDVTPAMPRFRFRPAMHEPGVKTVMGRRYGEEGEREGVNVIRDLARHPSTARFVSFKLARHFVADDPPQTAVDRLTQVFRDTEGDLREVGLAITQLDEAWTTTERKFRTPQEWLVAVLRAVRAPEAPPLVSGVLQALRQPLWSPPAPKGYDDLTRVWADPDSLMNRAELARSLARRAPTPPSDLSPLISVVADEGSGTLREMVADQSIAPDERIALVFASPSFQWR